jgi:hypothetical protein
MKCVTHCVATVYCGSVMLLVCICAIQLDGSGSMLWAHPIDLHYTCSTLAGWPQLVVAVWQQDQYGRNEIGELHVPLTFPIGWYSGWLIVSTAGYGTARIPPTPGVHSIEVVTWRPEGTMLQEIGGGHSVADIILSTAQLCCWCSLVPWWLPSTDGHHADY